MWSRICLGLINLETFRKMMMTMGEPLSENEMNDMIKDLPIDEDGYWLFFMNINIYLHQYLTFFHSFIEYEHYLANFKPKEHTIPLSNAIEEKK